MKKRLLTLIIIPATLIGLSSSAYCQSDISSASNNTRPHNQNHKNKNLNVTEDQAKILVEAQLIKFGQDKESILKIDTIKLEKNKNFYIVYLSKNGSQQPNKFIIVDGQNGHTIPFPMQKPPMMKFKQHMMQTQDQPGELPPPPPEMN